MRDCQKPREESEVCRGRRLPDSDIDVIVARLTTPRSECGRQRADTAAVDTITRQGIRSSDVAAITDRLYKTQTQNYKKPIDENSTSTATALNEDKVNEIVDRLYAAQTVSSSGGPPPPNICTNATRVDQEEAKAISERLFSTHTKSSLGGEGIGPLDEMKSPNQGLKSNPIIEGLDTRFKNKQITETQKIESVGKLLKTQTTASQARLDNPRILLYPERTMLMNNVERIRTFQEKGACASQKDLQRREKWYN